MSVDANTVPELSNNRPDVPGELAIVKADPSDDELLERILSGEVTFNFSYLPPRPIGSENLNIDPTKVPLVDPNKPPERIIYL